MKKLFAMILSALLLSGIATPAFAAEDEPDKPALVAAEIISIPMKNRVVFSGGSPEDPDGIVVKLTYSDGSTNRTTIRATDHGYYADDELVDPGVYIQVVRYGVLTAGLWFANREVKAKYRYLSLPRPHDLEYISIQLFWFRERVITFFDQLLHSIFSGDEACGNVNETGLRNERTFP